MNRPVLAIDFDGTIADTNRVKSNWISQHLGLAVPPWKCDRTHCVPIIGWDAYEKMGNHVYERESTHKTPEVEGAIRSLRILSDRAVLHLVTARPPVRMEYAREWLAQRDVINLFQGFHSSQGSSKAAICEELNARALVDDDLRHLADVNLPGLRRFLLQAGDSSEERVEGVEFCRSWSELVEFLMHS